MHKKSPRYEGFFIYFYYVRHFLFIIISAGVLSSCATLAPYESLYVNDDEMGVGLSDTDNLSNNAKTYREGGQGGNSGKSGGGCGCN